MIYQWGVCQTKTSKDSKEATFLLNSVLDGFNDLTKNPNIVEHFKDLKIDFDVKNPFESFNDILSLNFDTNLINEQLRRIFSENALKSLNIIKDNANVYNKITKFNSISTPYTFNEEYTNIHNGSTGSNIINNNDFILNKNSINPSSLTGGMLDTSQKGIDKSFGFMKEYQDIRISTSLKALDQLKDDYEFKKCMLEELKRLNENILSLKISDEKYYVQNFSLTKDDLDNFQKCVKNNTWSYKKFMDEKNS